MVIVEPGGPWGDAVGTAGLTGAVTIGAAPPVTAGVASTGGVASRARRFFLNYGKKFVTKKITQRDMQRKN